MAFPGELIRKVGWKIARPNSADTVYRPPELRLGRQGYLITSVQEPLPTGLKSIELGPKKKGVESIVWNPAVVQVVDERLKRESGDANGKKAHDHAQYRVDWLNKYRPRKYKLIIKDYPTEAVLIKIAHVTTPEDATNPQGNEATTIYVATASLADHTSQ